MACIFFFATGRAFLPHLGLQNDEALFAWPLFEPKAGLAIVKVFGTRVPVMLMSYLGTLKAALYKIVFRLARPTPSSIRLPVLLAGTATVWLFYLFLRRVSGRRAAILGCVLLAADTMFLLTTTFDWGPVALQHLLVVGAMTLLLRFYQHDGTFALAGAFFLFGLQLWDKALALWMLGGLVVAAAVVLPKQVWRVATPRRVALAAAAFALGAAPFLAYNMTSEPSWMTFRGTAGFSTSDLQGKVRLAPTVLDGSALLGWLVRENSEAPRARAPKTALQRACFELSDATGHVRHSLLAWAFLAALALAPLARGAELRGILFAIVAIAVAWGQMLITNNAGGSAHHVVLLWPLPHMVIALSFTAAARRLGRYAAPALAAAGVAVAASSLLVTNQYYVQMIRNGAALNWNDGIYPLAEYMKSVPARFVFVTDWGILDSLRLLNRGRLPLVVGCDPINKPALTEADKEAVRAWLTVDSPVFVGHTPGNEFYAGAGAMLRKVAVESGYQPEVLAAIPDSFGMPVFEVVRFSRADSPAMTTAGPAALHAGR